MLAGLWDLTGISKPDNRSVDEELKVSGRQSYTFKHKLNHSETKGAQMLLTAQNADGIKHPLLTANQVGKGEAMAVFVPLLSQEKGKNYRVPTALIKEILEQALPSAQRLLVTNAPETVETILRQKNNQHIVHLVNHAEGDRELIKITWHRYYYVTNIPPVRLTTFSLKLGAKPTSVKLQPQNQQITNWHYNNGILEVEVPGFDIHQMVVVEQIDTHSYIFEVCIYWQSLSITDQAATMAF